jgi:hypothetical protein
MRADLFFHATSVPIVIRDGKIVIVKPGDDAKIYAWGGSHQLPAESRCRVWPGHRLLTSPKGRGLWVRARGLCGAP